MNPIHGIERVEESFKWFVKRETDKTVPEESNTWN